jgi:SnoaL-like domain
MSESTLEDRAAIHDLFTRYCCALDNGEIEIVVNCFTVDAVLKSPVIHISGRDEIRASAGRFAAQSPRARNRRRRSTRRGSSADIYM